MPSAEENTAQKVRALLGEYEQFLAGKAQGTREAYLRTVRQLIGWLAQLPGHGGQFRPSQLTQTAVEQYLAHLEQEGLSRGLGRVLVNRIEQLLQIVELQVRQQDLSL